MGCKQISSVKERQTTLSCIKDKHLNFAVFRDSMKTQSTKTYEIKIKIYEIVTQSNETKSKRLICKYLYFKADGSFQSLISNSETKESYTISGHLTPSKDLKFTKTTGDEVLEYKGVINTTNVRGRELVIEGKIANKGIEVSNTLFSFELPKMIWAIEYFNKNGSKVYFPIYMSFKKGVFNGISFDDTGVGLWVGVEKEQKKDKIVQIYIKEENKEERCMVYEGTSDKIQGIKIKGTVKNDALELNSPFTLQLISDRTHTEAQE